MKTQKVSKRFVAATIVAILPIALGIILPDPSPNDLKFGGGTNRGSCSASFVTGGSKTAKAGQPFSLTCNRPDPSLGEWAFNKRVVDMSVHANRMNAYKLGSTILQCQPHEWLTGVNIDGWPLYQFKHGAVPYNFECTHVVNQHQASILPEPSTCYQAAVISADKPDFQCKPDHGLTRVACIAGKPTPENALKKSFCSVFKMSCCKATMPQVYSAAGFEHDKLQGKKEVLNLNQQAGCQEVNMKKEFTSISYSASPGPEMFACVRFYRHRCNEPADRRDMLLQVMLSDGAGSIQNVGGEVNDAIQSYEFSRECSLGW